ncbi:protein rogdi homolog [Rhynochetos jubatus]
MATAMASAAERAVLVSREGRAGPAATEQSVVSSSLPLLAALMDPALVLCPDQCEGALRLTALLALAAEPGGELVLQRMKEQGIKDVSMMPRNPNQDEMVKLSLSYSLFRQPAHFIPFQYFLHGKFLLFYKEKEFKWLLEEEVHAVLKQLQDILKEASHRFTLPASSSGGAVKQENFVLSTTGTDQVKGVLTLQGDALCQADVNLKIPRNNQLLHFAFREDKQWKLQQIQDARNHVNQAIYLLMNRDVNYQFKTGSEVLKLMDAVMLQLSRARNRLTTPASLTLPEIASSGLTKMFTPALPPDILVNFYINLNKLCLTVYQLHVLQPSTTKNFKPAGGSILHNPGAMFEFGNQRYEVSHVHKVECVVPWLNDALVFFTVSLQLCQQLKDKISVFSSYWNYKPY